MKRDQRGASLVEAALVIPILLMLLMGILEFGRLFNEYQVLTNAAREACRYAVAPDPTSGSLPSATAIQQVATNWLNSAGVAATAAPSVNTAVSCGTFTNPITGTAQSLNCTSVQVTASFSFLVPQLLFGSSSMTIPLSSTAVMRQETNN